MPMNVKLTRLAENRLRASVTPDSYGHLQIHYLIWFPKQPLGKSEYIRQYFTDRERSGLAQSHLGPS